MREDTMIRRRRLRAPAALCWLLAGAVLAAGCGTSAPAAKEALVPAAPVVTAARAAAIVRDYEQRNNTINAAFDSAGLAGIEAPPLRISSEALMTISKRLRQKIPHIAYTDTSFVTPAQPGYPRWFLSISRRAIGGVPAAQPTYGIYVQDKPSDRYLAAYALTPAEQETVGPFALNSAGAANAVTSGADLVLAPGELARAITDHYVKGLGGKDAFEQSAPLDDSLGNGFVLGRQILGTRGVKLTRTVASAATRTFALRTADGGAVAFTAVTVTDRLVAEHGKATASLRAGSNDAALFGKPSGARAKSFTIERLETFMTYLPAKVSGTKAKVLAYNETAVSVK
jgi:hypothetical protein